MKTTIKIGLGLLAVAALAFLTMPFAVFSQTTPTVTSPNTWADVPNTPISTPAGAQLLVVPSAQYGGVAWAANATVTPTNVATGHIQLRDGKGIALLAQVSGEAAADGVMTLNFQISMDKTNWTTIAPIPFGLQLSGTNLITRYTNVPPDVLNNAKWLRLGSLVNGDAAKTGAVWRLQYGFWN